MSKIEICDVCGNNLHVENQHAEFKLPKCFWSEPRYDGTFGGAYNHKRKLDVCFNCWHKFKDWVNKEIKSEDIDKSSSGVKAPRAGDTEV